MNKWNDDKTRRIRTKFKNILKREENRNCLTFYVEFAQIEYDLGRIEQAEHIYVSALSQSNPITDDDCTRAEYWHVVISYVEMLIREQKESKALNLLSEIAIGNKIESKDFESNETTSEASHLLASKKLDERLKSLCFIERNVSIIDTIQCFQPDYLICMVKANIYHKLLWHKTKLDAVELMETLLKTFPEKNMRHEFIREHLFETYADLMMYKVARSGSAGGSASVTMSVENATFSVISRGIDEFPTNMHLLRCVILCHNQPWHRIRGLLIKHHSPIAIMFLVVAAQYRCKKYAETPINVEQHMADLTPDVKDLENAYKKRITNLLKKFTAHETPTTKNSLLWRLYLRSLLDISHDFDKCRNILLTALNECPWNKVSSRIFQFYVQMSLNGAILVFCCRRFISMEQFMCHKNWPIFKI